MKQIKDGERSNLGGLSLEKHSILITSAKLNEAQSKQSHESNNPKDDFFGNDNLQ